MTTVGECSKEFTRICTSQIDYAMIKQLRDQVKSNIQICFLVQNQLCLMVKHNQENVKKM